MNANEIIADIGRTVAKMSIEDAEEFLSEIIEDCEIRVEALAEDRKMMEAKRS